MENIAIIGTGNMGTALIEGLLKSRFFNAENIFATRSKTDRLYDLQ